MTAETKKRKSCDASDFVTQKIASVGGSAVTNAYAYDALGRRIGTTSLSTANHEPSTVYHVYDGDQCVADTDASGSLLRAYTWGPGTDNLLAVTVYSASATNTYYAVRDRLGSVHALTDASGSVAAQFTYDAWGNLLSHSGTLELLNFSVLFHGGAYSAATGLYQFRARWYVPELGRWLSPDPIGLEGGLNLYEFCRNDPVNGRDPSGLWTLQIGVSGTVGGSSGGTIGGGFVVSNSSKGGFQIGAYGIVGGGAYIGLGASVTGDATWSPNEEIDQLAGKALTIGGSYSTISPGPTFGGEVNIPIDELTDGCSAESTNERKYPYPSVTVSGGMGVGSPEVHVFLTKTWAKGWRLW